MTNLLWVDVKGESSKVNLDKVIYTRHQEEQTYKHITD